MICQISAQGKLYDIITATREEAKLISLRSKSLMNTMMLLEKLK